LTLIGTIRNFFLAKDLQQTDDPFESVKYRVLLNFSLFLLVINLPYTFMSWFSHPLHFASAIVQNLIMLFVIFCLRSGKYIQLAIAAFIVNLYGQNLFHFLINNGLIADQGIMFYTLICLLSFILLGRNWGWATTAMVIVMMITGIYNKNNDFILFHFPKDLADPTTEGGIEYILVLPFLLNIYLVSQYVKAQNQAKFLLSTQKKAVSEKNREIIESLRYARRIQRSLMPTTKYISSVMERLKKRIDRS
jgi:hypothetical protein